jgi:hypothetical protein
VTAFVTAGGGFLLAVLWFDLMFDVQAARHRSQALPEDVLASITGYYRRVTAGARPMNRLVAAAMVLTLVAVAVQIGRDDAPDWVAWTSLGLVSGAVALAAFHTVPSAVRLGTRQHPVEHQSRAARLILRDHLVCIAAIATMLVLQLVFAS